MTAVLIASVLISLFGLGTVLWYARADARTRAAHRLARSVDLALDPDLEREVARRIARRERVGGLAGLLVLWLTVAGLGMLSDVLTAFAPLLAAVGYLLGHAVGYGLVAWDESRRPAPPGPRVARASTPTHGDYVARHERWGAWVAAGLATLIAGTLVAAEIAGVRGVPDVPWGLVVTTAALPWVAIAVDEVLARRLLDRRQVASSSLELAWDDAMRARTLRDMVTVPLMLGLYLPLILTGVVSDAVEGRWPNDPMVAVAAAIFLGVLGGAALMGGVSMALAPQRHFRVRLWPRTPAEQAAVR